MWRSFSIFGKSSLLVAAILSLLILGAVLVAAPVLAATTGQSSGSDGSIAVSGYFFTRYVFRSAETTTPAEKFRDQDVHSELRMDVAAPRSGMYEFHFLGTLHSDLDGNQNTHTFDPLEDIGNTTSSRTTGYVYDAHLDINNLFSRLTQIRLGRQAGTRDEGIYFDGIALDVRAARMLNLTVYGGAAVHFYEIDRKEADDTLAGAGIDFTPTAWTGLSIDYLTLKDKRNYYQFTDQQNDLVSYRLWQRLSQNIKATAKVRTQDSETRDLSVRLLATFPGAGTEFGAGYFRQFKTQGEQVNELSPFVDVMGPSFPYQTIDVKFRQQFGQRYAVDLGYYRRAVLDSANTGTFNRDFSRGSGAVSVSDFIWRDLSVTVSGDWWSSESNDYYSAGADLSYRFAKKGRVSAGTYYSLYKYGDLFFPGEMDRVRTYYLNTKVPLAKVLVLDLAYELEKGVDVFHVMKAGLRYDF